jgi:hypothetical protein
MQFRNYVGSINKGKAWVARFWYIVSSQSLSVKQYCSEWGFDETSLDDIATLNQWCRIKEGEALPHRHNRMCGPIDGEYLDTRGAAC